MSLINEALKKAQTQRAVDSASILSAQSLAQPTGAAPVRRLVKRSQPVAAGTVIGLIIAGLIGLIGLGVIGYIYAPFADTPPSVTPAQAKRVEQPTQVASPAIAVGLPAVIPPVEVVPVVPPLPPAAKPSAKIIEFVDSIRITGIRASETDPKVIFNGRVYRLNELVDKSLKVKLLRVEATCLIFVDANGIEYPKPL